MTPSDFDLTPLKAKGVQHLHGFFSEEMRQDLAKRAQEVIDLRAEGKLTTYDQDSRGLPGEWYLPLIEHPEILKVVTAALGPDVCSIGFRVLVKDRHFKKAIAIHQDWPYNPGDTKKLTVFIPLTPVSRSNGGLVFLEESHLYGPQSRGTLDPSRFDPMEEVCPSAEVGDLLLCDFLTWHYSQPPEAGNDDERIMIQINYQPASDASGTHLVAGKFPHNRRHALPTRFEASPNPSTDVNLPFARGFLQEGDDERATRYAKGLLYDDPDHAGAALLMCEALARKGDPASSVYLEQARVSLSKMQNAIAAFDEAEEWRELVLPFFSKVSSRPDSTSLPALLATPAEAWGYGAISEIIPAGGPVAVRIRAKVISGQAGLCLINEACTALVSEQRALTSGSEDTIVLAIAGDKAPARLLIRNFDGEGRAGEVQILSVAVRDHPAAGSRVQ